MHEVEFCEIYEVHENIVHQIEDGMPSEEVIQNLADFYKVFGGKYERLQQKSHY